MSEYSIKENYHRYFDIKVVESPEELKEAFAIRYRVYGEEFGFENVSELKDGLETDEYDAHSIHCLIRHKPSGRAAGCVRLVPALETEQTHPMPMEKYCASCLDQSFLKAMAAPRETMCEVSRLAVDSSFRLRSGERRTRFGSLSVSTTSAEERRTFPLIAVSAFLAMTSVCNLTGRTNAFLMAEPFLPRLLSRSGILVEKVGHDINYHGIRAPYYISSLQAAEGLVPDLKELYESINDILAEQLLPAVSRQGVS